MKKINTVKAHREFDRIIRHGKAIKSPRFSVYYLPSELDHVRIGVAVGKKNGIAVRRVLIKRQVRAIVEKAMMAHLPADVIIAVRAGYDPKDYHGAEGELLASLAQVKETIH